MPRAGPGRPAAPRRAAVLALLVQSAEAAEIRQHPVAIFDGQRLIELRLRQRLAQQLRDVAVEIGSRLAKANPASGERPPGLGQVGALTVGHEDFHRHLQLAAVGQRRVVMMRDPHRSGVEVQAIVESRGLAGTVLFAHGAAAHREHPAAGPRARLRARGSRSRPCRARTRPSVPASPAPRIRTRTLDTRPASSKRVCRAGAASRPRPVIAS